MESGETMSKKPIDVYSCEFSTSMGWASLAARDGILYGLTLGYKTAKSAQRAINEQLGTIISAPDLWPEFTSRVQKFLDGAEDDLLDIEIDDADYTPFQSRVVNKCRRIRWGETLAYGELAAQAGAPGAARAVGSVMAANRFPLVIPCHRVVRSNGALGGFSAATGTSFKQALLDSESFCLTRR